MSKVRIYDLARELRPESKKILEDARRMGVDLSVPANKLDETGDKENEDTEQRDKDKSR